MTENHPSIDEIQNFYQVTSLLGTAGQPFQNQFPTIRQAGYETVINLATPDSPDSVPDEPKVVQALGMEYVAIPVEWEYPTDADLDQFFACMDQRQGKKMFVHCARNLRVSSFVYLYRVIRQGVPPAAAKADLLALWEPNETWQLFIDESLARFNT
jgi:protein tyrosine phosphatase (PTP) superfamily phosphohydrolase (DUF442 family)